MQYDLLVQTSSARRTWLSLLRVGQGIAIVLAALAATALALSWPLLLAMALGAAALGALVLLWPTPLAFPLAVAVLYTNVAVVGVHFWGLPAITPLIVPALMMPAFAALVLRGDRRLVLDRGFLLLLAFVAVNFAAAVTARSPTAAAPVLFQLLSEGLLVYFLVSNLTRSQPVLISLFWAVAGSAAFTAALALIQQLTSTAVSDFGGLAYRIPESAAANAPLRAAGPIGDPNFFAQILIMAMPLAAALIVLSSRTLVKAVAGVAFALIVVGVALTGSRGGAIAVVAVAVLLPLIPGISARRLVLAAGVFAVVVLAVVPGYVERIVSIAQVESAATGGQNVGTSIQGRIVENLVAIQMFEDHPLLGVGPGNYPVLYEDYAANYLGFQSRGERPPHSLPLQILAENGIVGILSFAFVIAFLMRSLWVARSRVGGQGAVLASACLLALVGYLVTGLFLHAAYLRYLWLLLAIAGSAVAVIGGASRGKPRPASQ